MLHPFNNWLFGVPGTCYWKKGGTQVSTCPCEVIPHLFVAFAFNPSVWDVAFLVPGMVINSIPQFSDLRSSHTPWKKTAKAPEKGHPLSGDESSSKHPFQGQGLGNNFHQPRLVGGFNPFEKYERQNGFIFPNFRGEHSKNIWVATNHPIFFLKISRGFMGIPWFLPLLGVPWSGPVKSQVIPRPVKTSQLHVPTLEVKVVTWWWCPGWRRWGVFVGIKKTTTKPSPFSEM